MTYLTKFLLNGESLPESCLGVAGRLFILGIFMFPLYGTDVDEFGAESLDFLGNAKDRNAGHYGLTHGNRHGHC